jgi:hypothetical protein
MARRVGCDVSAFDGREEEKEGRTEEMNVNPIRTMSIFFFFSFSLSLEFFLFSLPSCILSDDCICQFSHLLRRLDENENGDAFLFLLFFFLAVVCT